MNNLKSKRYYLLVNIILIQTYKVSKIQCIKIFLFRKTLLILKY